MHPRTSFVATKIALVFLLGGIVILAMLGGYKGERWLPAPLDNSPAGAPANLSRLHIPAPIPTIPTPAATALVDLGEIALLAPNKRILVSVYNANGVGMPDVMAILFQHGDTDITVGIGTDETGTVVHDAGPGGWDIVLSLDSFGVDLFSPYAFRQSVSFRADQIPELKRVEFTIHQVRLPLVLR
jgi:hypothetical protein